MANSTESKLKSKYQSSTKKIQQLYDQFSSMRKYICTPSKKNRIQVALLNGEKVQRNSVNYSFQAPIPKTIKSRQLFKNEGLTNSSFQNQVILKNAMTKQLTGCFIEMDKRVDQKINLTQVRLQHLKKLFLELAKFYKIKQEKIRSKLKKNKCKCSEVEYLLKQIERKYEKKISQMSFTYQNKISLLVKQHQETSDSSNSNQIPKQFKEQLQKLQDKLIVKDQEITGLKIQTSRLRKSLDHHKVLAAQKQSLIEELTNQISTKELKLAQLVKIKIQKLAFQQAGCLKCVQLEGTLKAQKKQIQNKKSQIKELRERLQNLAKDLAQKKQDHPKKDSKHSKSWCESQILDKDLAVSDYEQQTEMVSNIKGIDEKFIDHEPLRHTQYFNANNKKNNFRYEQKIKQLQIQLQLVLQENKFLKSKKDKFQQQCKQNESDEQKFQMQCQILRDQLKNMNINLRILDDCALNLLKQKKIAEQNVERLGDMVKFKEEYFKKYPKKKQKSIKS